MLLRLASLFLLVSSTLASPIEKRAARTFRLSLIVVVVTLVKENGLS